MLTIHFIPIFDDAKLVKAAEDYDKIWKQDGPAICSAFKKFSGLSFAENRIGAVIYEGVSFSGRSPNDIMKLRASYPYDTKKATLIHELGHRLLFEVYKKKHDIDSHQILFLILYDVLVELYGKKFADEQVKIESLRKGLYSYKPAWKWVLSLKKEERAHLFQETVQEVIGK